MKTKPTFSRFQHMVKISMEMSEIVLSTAQIEHHLQSHRREQHFSQPAELMPSVCVRSEQTVAEHGALGNSHKMIICVCMCFLYSRELRSPHISKWTVHLHFLSGGGSTLKCSICKKGTHVCALQIYTHKHTTYRAAAAATLNARRESLSFNRCCARLIFFTFTGGTCRARGPSTAQPTPKAHTPSPYSHTPSRIAKALCST